MPRPSATCAPALGLVLAIALAACLDTTASPAASVPASLPASAAEPTAVPSFPAPPTATPQASPDQADVPLFAAGTILRTTTTVRLRDLPGTQWGSPANLPSGSRAQVVLGPVRTSGFGWYLVRDADPAAPTFIEGWVAAGFAPDAFLAAAPGATPPPASPTFVDGWSGTRSGDFGPFTVQGSTALRWAAAVETGAPDAGSCTFQGSVAPQGGTPVYFVKTTVAQAPSPGTVQASFFVDHPALKGDLFIHVESDCAWAVSVVRLPL